MRKLLGAFFALSLISVAACGGSKKAPANPDMNNSGGTMGSGSGTDMGSGSGTGSGSAMNPCNGGGAMGDPCGGGE